MKLFLCKAGVTAAFMVLTMSHANATLISAMGSLSSNDQNNRTSDHLIDGSGIELRTGFTDVNDPASYQQDATQDGTNTNTFGVPTSWSARTSGSNANVVDNEWVIIDLGSDVLLDSVNIFNLAIASLDNNRTDRGTNAFELFVATDVAGIGTNTDQNGTAFSNSTFTPAGTHNLARLNDPTVGSATNNETALPLNISLAGTTARYIAVDINSSYGDSFVGLGEIQVFAAVPEPSSLALLGICALGLVIRRKR